MKRTQFERMSFSSIWQQLDAVDVTLVANAAPAPVATLDITYVKFVTITLDVTVADLTAVEIWVRGDKNGRWFQMDIAAAYATGRTDPGSDITVTPAGQAFFISLERRGWSDVMVKAKSAGAAKITVTAGGQ